MQSERATRPDGARFPFPGYPRGWFVVALSTDIPSEGVVRLRYFGRDLIAYRGASGRAYVTDAYCPHLGAHLGHGGTVEGETLRCPFHGWRFGPDGRCVEIPYSDKIPTKARVATWPVCEQDGVVHVFHDPSHGAPWALPKLEEEGWTPARSVLWAGLRSHPQEVFENTVDMAHIGPIHAGRGAAILGKPVRDGERLDVSLEFQAPGDVVGMPDQLNDVHLDVCMRGLGWVVVHTHVTNVDIRARQRIYVTPVDEDTIDIRGLVCVRETDDPAFTEELAEIFYRAYVEDFAKDFPIWENKRYLERPQLAPGDGPIGLYRRWCTQFYVAAGPEHGNEAPDVELTSLRRDRASHRDAGWRRPLEPVQNLLRSMTARLGLDPMRDAARGMLETLRPSTRAAVGSSPAPTIPSVTSPPEGAAPSSPVVESEPLPRGPATGADAPGSGAPLLRVESADEYYETLSTRFVPSAARGLDAVFQWELDGEGGATFHAVVMDGHLELRRGPHPSPTVCLAIPAPDYVRVVNGELDGMRAFTSGRGKVRGSVRYAMKMRALFPA